MQWKQSLWWLLLNTELRVYLYIVPPFPQSSHLSSLTVCWEICHSWTCSVTHTCTCSQASFADRPQDIWSMCEDPCIWAVLVWLRMCESCPVLIWLYVLRKAVILHVCFFILYLSYMQSLWMLFCIFSFTYIHTYIVICRFKDIQASVLNLVVKLVISTSNWDLLHSSCS